MSQPDSLPVRPWGGGWGERHGHVIEALEVAALCCFIDWEVLSVRQKAHLLQVERAGL